MQHLTSLCDPADYYSHQDGMPAKHIPLSSAVSLNKPIYTDESERTLMDVVSAAPVSDPEELIISRENFADIELRMNEVLSDTENVSADSISGRQVGIMGK